PREAAYAIRFLGVKHVVPMHYATFPALTGTPEKLREETGRLRLDHPRAQAGRNPVSLSRNLRSGYVDEKVDEYLYSLLPPRDPVLADMEEYAAQHDVPIIGPAVGRLLALQ